MQAYYVNQRIDASPGGEAGKEGQQPILNPFELLGNSYQPADLNQTLNGFQLMCEVNDPDNPIAIAMTLGEAREIFERGPEIRHDDARSFFSQADPNSLVVVEPVGVSSIETHHEYLPDLARSGKNFPEITDAYVWPVMFTKNLDGETVDIVPMPDHYDVILGMAKRPQQPEFTAVDLKDLDKQAPGVPYPTDLADVRETDAYFFANVSQAAKILAARVGKAGDQEFEAGIGITLNHSYSINPNGTLRDMRDVLTGGLSISITAADVEATQQELRSIESGNASSDKVSSLRPSQNPGIDRAVEEAGEESRREEWIYRMQGFIPETDNVSWQRWRRLFNQETTSNAADGDIEKRYQRIVTRIPEIEAMEQVSQQIRKSMPLPQWQAKLRESGIKPEEADDETLGDLYEDNIHSTWDQVKGAIELRCALRARIITLENSWNEEPTATASNSANAPGI